MFDDLDSFIASNAGDWGYDASGLSGLDSLTNLVGDQTGGYDPASMQDGALGAAFDGGSEGTMSRDDVKSMFGTSDEPVTTDKQNALLKALGFKATADGSATDFSDPKSLSQLMKLIGIGGNFLTKAMSGKAQQQQQSSALQSQLAQQAQRTWTPQQAMMANDFFNRGYSPVGQRQLQFASQVQSPIVAGRGYAEGGEVLPEEAGPLEQGFELLDRPQGYIGGPSGGQDDLVPANLGHGEYVLDADLVAALGDGNNEAGAQRLDAWREKIRKHKRAAGPDEIPPRAKTPAQYMKGIK